MQYSEKIKDMDKFNRLHKIVTAIACLTGCLLGYFLREDMQVTIATLVTCISVILSDVRVISLSQIQSTYGQITEIKRDKDGYPTKIFVDYKPMLKTAKRVDVTSNKVISLVKEEKLLEHQMVLVEYERGNEWIAIGTLKHIICEIVANISAWFMVAHFTVLFVSWIATKLA